MPLTKTLQEQFSKTNLSNSKTKEFIGSILRKEFDNPETSYERASDILAVAYQLNVPQVEEMIFDHNFENFKF